MQILVTDSVSSCRSIPSELHFTKVFEIALFNVIFPAITNIVFMKHRSVVTNLYSSNCSGRTAIRIYRDRDLANNNEGVEISRVKAPRCNTNQSFRVQSDRLRSRPHAILTQLGLPVTNEF